MTIKDIDLWAKEGGFGMILAILYINVNISLVDSVKIRAIN